jgi:hypothetical protein
MAAQCPNKANFLNDLLKRTLDLEDVFKEGYVNNAFAGLT